MVQLYIIQLVSGVKGIDEVTDVEVWFVIYFVRR